MIGFFISLSLSKNFCLMAESDKEHCTLADATTYQTFEEIKTNAADDDITVQIYNSTANTLDITLTDISTKKLVFYGDEMTQIKFNLTGVETLTDLSVLNAHAGFTFAESTQQTVNAEKLALLNSQITVADGSQLNVVAQDLTFDDKSIQFLTAINASKSIVIQNGQSVEFSSAKVINFVGTEATTLTSYLPGTESTVEISSNITFQRYTIIPQTTKLVLITDVQNSNLNLNINGFQGFSTLELQILNDTTLNLNCSLSVLPATVINRATLTLNAKSQNVPFKFEVRGNLFVSTELNEANIKSMSLVEKDWTIQLEAERIFNLEELTITNASKFITTKYTPISIDSFLAENVHYDYRINENCLFNISKVFKVIDSSLHFHHLNLMNTVKYSYVIGLKGTGVYAEVLKNYVTMSISVSYFNDTMPTDEEVEPALKKEASFLKARSFLCESVNPVLPDSGVVGFTKSTSVLDIQCVSGVEYTNLYYKIDDYPSRVYPNFCYGEDCEGFQFAKKNGDFGTYITKYTRKATVQIMKDMSDSDSFSFDGASQKPLWIGGNGTIYPKFNLKASDSTVSSLTHIFVTNVTVNIVGQGLKVNHAEFDDVKFAATSKSVGLCPYLLLSKKAYETVPEADLTDYFIDATKENTIQYTESGYTLSSGYTMQKRGNTLPILAFEKEGMIITITKSGDDFLERLRYGFINNTSGSITFKIDGDWKKECIESYPSSTVTINMTSSLLPLYISTSMTVNVNAKNAYAINPLTISSLAVTINSETESTLDSLIAYGKSDFKSKMTTLGLLDCKDNMYGTVDVKKLTKDLHVLSTVRINLATTDISDIGIASELALEETNAKIDYSASYLPKSFFVNITINPSIYNQINKNFYFTQAILVTGNSDSNVNLTKWQPISSVSAKKMSTPNTDLDIALTCGSELIMVTFQGYKPKITYALLSSAEILWTVLGSIFLVALIAMIIWCCCKWNRKRRPPEDYEEAGILDDIESIDDVNQL